MSSVGAPVSGSALPGRGPTLSATRLRPLCLGGGAVAVVIGLLGLVGWWADVPVLRSGLSGHPPILPNTAVLFVLAGGSVLPPGRRTSWLPPALAALTSVLSSIIVLEWVLERSLGVDRTLLPEPVASLPGSHVGRVSVQLAIALVLFGLVRLASAARGRWSRTLGNAAAVGFGAIVLAVELSYLFEAGELTRGRSVGVVSIPSAAGLLALATAVVCLKADRRPVRWLFERSLAGSVVRRLLPAAVIVPPLLGVLHLYGLSARWYGPRLGMALFTGSVIAAFVSLISYTALVIARIERSRGLVSQQLDALFEHIPASLTLRDLGGRYLRVNTRLARRRGVTPDDMIGKTMADFYPAERARLFTEHDAVVARTLLPDVQTYELPAGDGVRHTETTRFPVFDAGGQLMGIGTFALDVSERVRSERHAEAAAERLATFLDSIPDATVVIDERGIIRYANGQVTPVLGYEVAELVGQQLEVLVPDSAKQRHTGLRADYNHARRPMGGRDLTARHRDGHEIPVDISLGPVGTGEDAWTLASIRDVTEKRAAQDQLRAAEERYRHLAEHDPLTGLWNRRRFSEELEAHLALCRRGEAGGALLSLDLDHFKTVNDTYGHHIGDRLLISVADAMRRTLRASDGVARQGGDEFLILLRGGEERAAVRAADALVAAVRHSTELLAAQVGPEIAVVTASVGVVVFDALAVDDLASGPVLIRADHALYAAKSSGRDRTSVAAPAGVPAGRMPD